MLRVLLGPLADSGSSNWVLIAGASFGYFVFAGLLEQAREWCRGGGLWGMVGPCAKTSDIL